MLVIIVHSTIAKNNPNPSAQRLLAFKRAKSLDNGISVSWLEQTWNKDMLNQDKLTKTDFELLKTLGFKSLRLPVAFSFFEAKNIPLENVFNHIDKVVKLCHLYGIKLIIDYHYGELNDNNYLTQTPRIINVWLTVAKRYIKQSPDDVFFELYNEPPHMSPQIWKDAAYNIVTALRKVDKKRTFIVGASNFNSIYELSRTERMADENIIYTVHFYEPFLFTHQGANWVGDQVATTGVPFPYSAEKFPTMNPKTKGTWGETNYYQYRTDGNEQSMVDKLAIVKRWAEKYDVPLICTEYGSYKRYTDQDSRCHYIKAIRRSLKKLNIPGIMWEYDSDFSIFNGKPALVNLPDCMKDAIGYISKN
ncbi:glycoside hydrolase family 5 protein [Mucilaginibacter panaciglaebae]|uniref:Glycoside hydrolase family 5 protein n=2 Tax=Mucilaginibacter panaciglaebae TaxID=502331 RepID=A0ABP7WUF6_9SPHI